MVTRAMADPGQAMADPGEAMADPGEAMADPGEAMADPGEAMADPEAIVWVWRVAGLTLWRKPEHGREGRGRMREQQGLGCEGREGAGSGQAQCMNPAGMADWLLVSRI